MGVGGGRGPAQERSPDDPDPARDLDDLVDPDDPDDSADDVARRGPPIGELLRGALAAALLSAVVVSGLIRVWDQPLRVPFQYATSSDSTEQDATLEAMQIAAVAQTGWHDENPRLNAPYGQQWIEWPMGGDTLAYVIKKGMTFATSDPFLIMNAFWLLTFPLVAAAASPALRLLRASRGTALVGAVLYSLAPYHFRNGVGHENLAFYVAVPFAVLMCVRLLGPRPPVFGRRRRREPGLPRRPVSSVLWPLAGAVLIAVNSYYYLAFFLFVGSACALTAAVVQRSWRPVASMGVLAATSLAVAFAVSLPTILWTRSAGPNPAMLLARPRGSSDDFPLQLVGLFSPVGDHRFGPFGWLATQLAPRFYQPNTETVTASLGLFASVGVLLAVAALVGRILSRHSHEKAADLALGVVVLVAFLLACKGGGSRVLELTGAGSIRAWSRMAIFVAFAGVAAAARGLDRARLRLVHARPTLPAFVWPSVLALVIVVGVLDQVAPTAVPDANANLASFDLDKRFVASIEDRLPAGGMVFQLPAIPFPEAGATILAADYDGIKQGYLHSHTLRWSAGGVRGRTADWQAVATRQSTAVLVRGLAAVGFGAITVDRAAYLDRGRRISDEITDVLGPPFTEGGNRLVAWDLQPFADEQRRTSSDADRERWRAQMLDAPRFYLRTDDNDRVSTTGNGYFCHRASASVVVPANRRWSGTLTISLERIEDPSVAPTVVRIGGVEHQMAPRVPQATYPVDLTGTTEIVVELPSVPTCTTPAGGRTILGIAFAYADDDGG